MKRAVYFYILLLATSIVHAKLTPFYTLSINSNAISLKRFSVGRRVIVLFKSSFPTLYTIKDGKIEESGWIPLPNANGNYVLAAYNKNAFICNSNNIYIYKYQNNVFVPQLQNYDMGGVVYAITVYGKYLYAVIGHKGRLSLKSYEYGTSFLTPIDSVNVDGRFSADIVVRGKYIYLSKWDRGISIFNINGGNIVEKQKDINIKGDIISLIQKIGNYIPLISTDGFMILNVGRPDMAFIADSVKPEDMILDAFVSFDMRFFCITVGFDFYVYEFDTDNGRLKQTTVHNTGIRDIPIKLISDGKFVYVLTINGRFYSFDFSGIISK